MSDIWISDEQERDEKLADLVVLVLFIVGACVWSSYGGCR